MKDFDTTICFVPGCEDQAVGQIVFIGGEFEGQRSWHSEIVVCEAHALQLEAGGETVSQVSGARGSNCQEHLGNRLITPYHDYRNRPPNPTTQNKGNPQESSFAD
ncbi:MAG TPA: hypothetical protein ENH00_03490 [Actinobacteria bacterium]|nr:hypothetical protein [Actinomycetota bacterium]